MLGVEVKQFAMIIVTCCIVFISSGNLKVESIDSVYPMCSIRVIKGEMGSSSFKHLELLRGFVRSDRDRRRAVLERSKSEGYCCRIIPKSNAHLLRICGRNFIWIKVLPRNGLAW